MSGLEFSANVTAEVVGKPSGKFFMASIDEFNVTPDECIMIGDVMIRNKNNLVFRSIFTPF